MNLKGSIACVKFFNFKPPKDDFKLGSLKLFSLDFLTKRASRFHELVDSIGVIISQFANHPSGREELFKR
jgi:hypothetical protein